MRISQTQSGLTDVTEFKWYEGVEVHKLYLCAILDLYDRRIVAYVIRDRNDNSLVFDTFKKAVRTNPDAHPLFHSDRGFQYTNRKFHQMLEEHKWYKVCLAWPTALTTVQWKAFGVFSSASVTMAATLLPGNLLFR